jgi:hypothetical protein
MANPIQRVVGDDCPLRRVPLFAFGQTRGALAAALLVGLGACAASVRPSAVPSTPLAGVGGSAIDTRDLTARAPLSVLVFFSSHCHCLQAHEARLRGLFDAYHPRGVQFVLVDSEVGGAPDTDAAEAKRRGYPFSILTDRGAKLADALGAEYATYTVVADASGRVRYRGGIDSDKQRLHDDATFFLRDALDDLLEGRPVRTPEGKTLGCVLTKR